MVQDRLTLTSDYVNACRALLSETIVHVSERQGSGLFWSVPREYPRRIYRVGYATNNLPTIGTGRRGGRVPTVTRRFGSKKALNGLQDWEKPRVINTDKASTYAAALADLKKEGKCP